MTSPETEVSNCVTCSESLIDKYIFKYNVDTKELLISPEWKRSLGYEQNEICNNFDGLWQLQDPDHRSASKKGFAAFLKSEAASRTITSIYNCKDGMPRWFEISEKKIQFGCTHCTQRSSVIISYATDITEAIKTELKRQNDKNIHAALINATTDLIFSVDKQFNVTAANNSFLEKIKLNAKNKAFILGDNLFSDLTYSYKTKTNWLELFKKAFEGEPFTFEQNEIIPDQDIDRWYEHHFSPVLDNDKTIKGVAVFSKDISNKKNADLANYNSRELFRSIFKFNSIKMLLVNSLTTVIEDANDAAVKFYGYPYCDLCKMNILDLFNIKFSEFKKRISSNRYETKTSKGFTQFLATGDHKKVKISITLLSELEHGKMVVNIFESDEI